MKKTLWSMVAGLAVIGSAFAVPSLDTQQQNCEGDPNFVWVEKAKTCVPINPCDTFDENYNQEIEKAYCDDFFNIIDMGDGIKREKLVKKYLGVSTVDIKLHNVIGGDGPEIGTMLVRYNGYYKAMPYGNGTESYGVLSPHVAACILYGGQFATISYEAEDTSTYCTGIKESSCEELAKFVSDLEGRNIGYKYQVDFDNCLLEIPFYGF